MTDDEPMTVTELAETWHAPDCTVDAGGACILDSDVKEAFVAGYVARAAGLGVARDSPAERFRSAVCAYVELPETDPKRPSWDEVDAAQQAFIDSMPGMRAAIARGEAATDHHA